MLEFANSEELCVCKKVFRHRVLLPFHVSFERLCIDSQERALGPSFVAGSPLLRGAPQVHVRLEGFSQPEYLVIFCRDSPENTFP